MCIVLHYVLWHLAHLPRWIDATNLEILWENLLLYETALTFILDVTAVVPDCLVSFFSEGRQAGPCG